MDSKWAAIIPLSYYFHYVLSDETKHGIVGQVEIDLKK